MLFTTPKELHHNKGMRFRTEDFQGEGCPVVRPLIHGVAVGRRGCGTEVSSPCCCPGQEAAGCPCGGNDT